jgi:hypothetical protein
LEGFGLCKYKKVTLKLLLSMAHKCFISFKTKDSADKKHILERMKIDLVDKSLHQPIDSDDEDYIMRKIRQDYLKDSTVTIHLIGSNSAETFRWEEQKFIKRELQASLYHGEGNTQSGILGVVLPSMTDKIYTGSCICSTCGKSHRYVNINNSTVVTEFSYNYYIPNGNKCSWTEADKFCVLVKWEHFEKDPEGFIGKAFNKRDLPIAEKTKVYP